MKSPVCLLVPLTALVLLAVPTRADELYQCTDEAGCMARINDDGTLEEVIFRKGDIVGTEAGWVISPDDGWKKIRKTECGGAPTTGGAVGQPDYLQAGGEVPDDSTWHWPGASVTVDITDPHWSGLTNVTVRFTSSGGSSLGVNGSEGDTSTPTSPTCDHSDVGSTPAGSFRVRGKYVEKLGGDGVWRRGRLFKKKSGNVTVLR